MLVQITWNNFLSIEAVEEFQLENLEEYYFLILCVKLFRYN